MFKKQVTNKNLIKMSSTELFKNNSYLSALAPGVEEGDSRVTRMRGTQGEQLLRNALHS